MRQNYISHKRYLLLQLGGIEMQLLGDGLDPRHVVSGGTSDHGTWGTEPRTVSSW